MKRAVLGVIAAVSVAISPLAAAPAVAGDDGHLDRAVQATGRGKPAPQPSVLARRSAEALITSRAPALKVARGDRFSRGRVYANSGIQYVSYTRTHGGLPVIGGDFVVVTDSAGKVLDTSVAQRSAVRLGARTPRLTRTEARARAQAQVRRVATTGPTRLAILQRASSRLVWRTIVSGVRHGHASRLEVYVDARTGRIAGSREHVVNGTGTAGYSGPNPVSLSTQQSGSTYYLRDPAATTLQCQNASTNTTYSGTDDAWGNGDPTNRETGCVDALYGAQQMKGMLSTWLGLNGMNGSGGWVPIRVGLADINAYYDGTQVQIGHSQSGNRWISSIDVLAHEFGHGVDDKTPGGISGNGTQEFVGDVFATATEYYDNQPAPYDVPDFTIGEEVDLVGAGPIRNMANPAAVGDPACYSSSIPNAEVHAAAGPGDHWFYLLAQGGTSKCNSAAVSGLGVQAATKVMYNAMLMKTSSASYLKYRTWTLTAAKNLDATCAQFNAVKAAWDAVKVPAQSADPTCSGGGTSTVTVANPGAQSGTVGTAASLQMTATPAGTYSWAASGLPAGLAINAATGVISGTPSAAGTANVTVTASGGGQSGSVAFSWAIVNPGGGGACSGQKLSNGGFESGATGWSASSGVITTSTGRTPRSGSYYAWLAGYGSTHTDTLAQTVTLPAGCSAALTFYLHVDTAERTTSSAYDKLTVKAGSSTLATYSNLNAATGYTLRTLDLSAFAGQSVTLTFTGSEDVSLQTSFTLDDAAVTVS